MGPGTKVVSACMAGLALVATALAPSDARAWGLHYLLTHRALDRPELAALDRPVRAEPLEAFLAAAKDDLPRLFDEYYAWLGARGSKRFKAASFDPAKPTVEEFLKAARLNPGTRFAQIRRLMPGEGPAPGEKELKPADFGWWEETDNQKFPFRMVAGDGQELPARAVLATYADEPDWKMDQSLFRLEHYGYGRQPYGQPDGTSSRAPFHALFAHENVIVRLFAGEVTEGMPLDRVELFLRLARLAFGKGRPYWGHRFAAWAAHYVQDLSQPYHSRAVPFGDWPYYLKFMVSSEKERIKRETTRLAQNRHFAYEDFVAFGLQGSYTAKNELFSGLAALPASGALAFADVSDAPGLVEKVGAFASEHAPAIDAVVSAAFGPRVASDPEYDLEKDPSYSVEKVIAGLDPGVSARLLAETGKDFEMAGAATRTILRLAGAPGP